MHNTLGMPDSTWHVGNLPFFVQCNDVPDNSPFGLPDRMPFVLECDPETGTLRQQQNREVSLALEKAYSFGSLISGTMDDTGIGRRYAEDFLNFVLDSLNNDVAGKSVLEIGCGTGHFLSLLQERGASVLGVEPGPHGQEGGKKYGVPVIRDFFPCKQIQERFDVIIGYALLEHIAIPQSFLGKIHALLKEGGKLLLAVPDCEPYMQRGDISCLLHEHWSYFSSKTLSNELQRAGFCPSIQHADFGGSLYCCALPHREGFPHSNDTEVEVADTLAIARGRFYSNMKKLEQFFHESVLDGRPESCLGIYVPGRMINALSLAQIPEKLTFRFFDDNPLLKGKYYPSFPQKIEDFESLIHCPPDSLFVASRSFGQEIKTKIATSSHKIHLILWESLYEGEKYFDK